MVKDAAGYGVGNIGGCGLEIDDSISHLDVDRATALQDDKTRKPRACASKEG